MRTLLLSLSVLIAFSFSAEAQKFAVSPLVFVKASEATVTDNKFVNLTSQNIELDWKVTECDFPSDWIYPIDPGNYLRICDNKWCYDASEVAHTQTLQHTGDYEPGEGELNLYINLPEKATIGRYHLKITYYNTANRNDSASTTFFVTKSPLDLDQLTKATGDDVYLFPNPAGSTINFNFPGTLDVHTISIFSNIGKFAAEYKVGNNTPTLNIESLQAGLYFARLMNSNGGVMATLRFTKQ